MNCAATYAVAQEGRQHVAIEQYASLVQRIAHHLKGRLPEAVQVEDLVQAGMIGLLEAARNFDDGQGASFETYAGIRIRGAMLDEVRRNDWAPRSVYRKARQVAHAVREVENREGREAQSQEIAEELGLSPDEYFRLLQEASDHRLLSFDELSDGGDSVLERMPDRQPGITDQLQREQMQLALAEAITRLPEREQLVMSLYYDEGLNLKEIGAVLGVSESRVCQIHSQSLLRIRAYVQD